MSVKAYGGFSTIVTPQTEPIPGAPQVQNDAGGYVYALDKWAALQRFLILGTESGTYYVDERKQTLRAATNTLACIAEDGHRAVDMIVAVSDAGRAPKNDAAEFALALATAAKDPATRAYALASLSKVCRIPTHLFHFITFARQQRGCGRGLRRAIGAWYDRWSDDDLAFELVKYQSRDGVSNADALRLSHTLRRNTAAVRWALGATTGEREVSRLRGTRTDRYSATGELPPIIAAFEQAKTADAKTVARLVREHSLTREMVPTAALNHAKVWEALLEKMPPHALLRNLGKMSAVGLLTPMSAAEKTVLDRLGAAADSFRQKRVHPIAVLIALKVYANGRGVDGGLTWTPVPRVVDALDDAFYASFGALEPTGKRLLFGLDVSGSMTMPFARVSGLPITPAEGATAMALACAKTERDYHIMGFDHGLRELVVTPRMRLDQALKIASDINGGGTDCSLPMTWALEHKVEADAFIVITDNETWAGAIHPSQALRQYRQKMGIAAREVVMGMTATNFAIADPADPGALDVVGFDGTTPSAVNEFVRG